LQRLLASPGAQLKADDSLRLVTACVTLGAAKAEEVSGHMAVMVVGNTGDPISYYRASSSFH